jgi:hypothetical protein
VGLQSEVCRKADIGVKCVTREVDYTRSTPFPGSKYIADSGIRLLGVTAAQYASRFKSLVRHSVSNL